MTKTELKAHVIQFSNNHQDLKSQSNANMNNYILNVENIW